MMSFANGLFALWLLGAAEVPADARLDGVRRALQTSLEDARRAHLPQDVLANKIAEGLAKSVPPARIVGAVQTLARHMTEGAMALSAVGITPDEDILVAYAEARVAGLSPTDAQGLFAPAAQAPSHGDNTVTEDATQSRQDHTRAALGTVTDLVLRAYPSKAAVSLVAQIQHNDPAALKEVSPQLETLRLRYALSPLDTLSSVGQALSASGTFATAVNAAKLKVPTVGGGQLKANNQIKTNPGKTFGTSKSMSKAMGISGNNGKAVGSTK